MFLLIFKLNLIFLLEYFNLFERVYFGELLKF